MLPSRGNSVHHPNSLFREKFSQFEMSSKDVQPVIAGAISGVVLSIRNVEQRGTACHRRWESENELEIVNEVVDWRVNAPVVSNHWCCRT